MENKAQQTRTQESLGILRKSCGRNYLNNKQRQEIEAAHAALDHIESVLTARQVEPIEGLESALNYWENRLSRQGGHLSKLYEAARRYAQINSATLMSPTPEKENEINDLILAQARQVDVELRKEVIQHAANCQGSAETGFIFGDIFSPVRSVFAVQVAERMWSDLQAQGYLSQPSKKGNT